jgi:hypothetical protein
LRQSTTASKRKIECKSSFIDAAALVSYQLRMMKRLGNELEAASREIWQLKSVDLCAHRRIRPGGVHNNRHKLRGFLQVMNLDVPSVPVARPIFKMTSPPLVPSWMGSRLPADQPLST